MIGALAWASEMPSGYFRGPMAGWDGTPAKGTLNARGTDGEVFTCGFDSKSYFEFQKQRVTVDKLREGDPLEVLAYRRPGETSCYVLSLTVIPPPTPTRPTKRIDTTPAKPTRTPVRHGNVNVSGVVLAVNSSSVTLRTREGEKTFLLRRDTRFFGNGLKMDRADLAINQRLAIEAGRNSEGQMEAFQLTWGNLTNSASSPSDGN